MKILFATPYFSPRVGGMENYARQIGAGLVSVGHEVMVVTANHAGRRSSVDEIDGMVVHRLAPVGRISNTPLPGGDWLRAIDRIIETFSPDLVNAHMPVPMVADLVARRCRGIPLVLTYQNDLAKPGRVANLACKMANVGMVRGTLLRARRIIVTSDHYAKRSPYLRPHLSRVTVIPPGVHLHRFKMSVKEPASPSILFVGQLDRTHSHKGLADLIVALPRIARALPAVTLRVVGRGDRVDYYRALTVELGVEQNVQFCGFVPDDDLPDFFANTTVLVLPSRDSSEGFGIVLLEAAAAGRPVIGTNVGGVPAALDDGVTGVLVPPSDRRLLEDAVIRVLSDPGLANQMGKAGRQRVEQGYSWATQVKRHDELFRTVAAGVEAA